MLAWLILGQLLSGFFYLFISWFEEAIHIDLQYQDAKIDLDVVSLLITNIILWSIIDNLVSSIITEISMLIIAYTIFLTTLFGFITLWEIVDRKEIKLIEGIPNPLIHFFMTIIAYTLMEISLNLVDNITEIELTDQESIAFVLFYIVRKFLLLISFIIISKNFVTAIYRRHEETN